MFCGTIWDEPRRYDRDSDHCYLVSIDYSIELIGIGGMNVP